MTSYGKFNLIVAIISKTEKYLKPATFTGKSVSEIRAILNKNATRWSTLPIPFPNIKNIDIITPENQVPVRIYTPTNGNNFPLIIYSHGGSWISGNLDTHDNICRKLAKKANAIVISVAYRLAPENPFPAGLNDVYHVLQWAYINARSIKGDPSRICVAGDSAGGNLSAAVCLMARDRNGPPIAGQVLIYPATNIFQLNTKSWREFGQDYILKKANYNKYIAYYAPKLEDRKNQYASPLLAQNFQGLPPALIITAEFDPLRDEGAAYAAKLRAAGIHVVSTNYQGVTHGFISFDNISKKANTALDEIAIFLQKEVK